LDGDTAAHKDREPSARAHHLRGDRVLGEHPAEHKALEVHHGAQPGVGDGAVEELRERRGQRARLEGGRKQRRPRARGGQRDAEVGAERGGGEERRAALERRHARLQKRPLRRRRRAALFQDHRAVFRAVGDARKGPAARRVDRPLVVRHAAHRLADGVERLLERVARGRADRAADAREEGGAGVKLVFSAAAAGRGDGEAVRGATGVIVGFEHSDRVAVAG
jgi:hypothetical protein